MGTDARMLACLKMLSLGVLSPHEKDRDAHSPEYEAPEDGVNDWEVGSATDVYRAALLCRKFLPELGEIWAGCLKENPAERKPAGWVAKELEGAQKTSTEAAAATAVEVARRKVGMSRWFLSGAAVALLAMSFVAFYLYRGWGDYPELEGKGKAELQAFLLQTQDTLLNRGKRTAAQERLLDWEEHRRQLIDGLPDWERGELLELLWETPEIEENQPLRDAIFLELSERIENPVGFASPRIYTDTRNGDVLFEDGSFLRVGFSCKVLEGGRWSYYVYIGYSEEGPILLKQGGRQSVAYRWVDQLESSGLDGIEIVPAPGNLKNILEVFFLPYGYDCPALNELASAVVSGKFSSPFDFLKKISSHVGFRIEKNTLSVYKKQDRWYFQVSSFNVSLGRAAKIFSEKTGQRIEAHPDCSRVWVHILPGNSYSSTLAAEQISSTKVGDKHIWEVSK